jgi:RNA-directed DNA polymerase
MTFVPKKLTIQELVKLVFPEEVKKTPEELFEHMFSEDELMFVFHEKFSDTSGKGIDRVNGFQFALQAKNQISIASRKCLDGTYRFAPYLEVLKLKGRGKAPRIIGIPTVRDRIVLCQLNRYLAQLFPDRVPKNVAATYVRRVAEDLSKSSQEDTWVCSTDIKTFYDTIQRPRLLNVLGKRVKSKSAISLLSHALQAPTVPKNTQRHRQSEFREKNGVPQGLAISNILASIYMQDVDEAMGKYGVTYYRYVDDVLMYGTHEKVHAAFSSLQRRLQRRGLGLHSLTSGKSQIAPLSKSFGYLGYVFQGETITVRDSTIEKFIQSIAAKFSDFRHNKAKRLERFKYLNEERLKEIFLLELNERITGAVQEDKRYGWIAYFSQITDLELLHKLDSAISGLFSRLHEFDNSAPPGLKKLRRSYWEMKFNPHGGYIRDYDAITTIAQQLDFLRVRGRVSDEETLTDEQITARYKKYVNHNLAAMQADEGAVY